MPTPIQYIELPAPDLARMKAFYGAAFGWSFQDWGPDYVSFEHAGLEGGFNPRRPLSPPGTGALIILLSEDLEAAEAAVVAAGGVIVERHSFPGGRRFHFRDTCGNELAVWTKEDH